MKKKIIFAVATGFFAVATMFNMNLLQANSAGDVSLEAIKAMAQANNNEDGTAVKDTTKIGTNTLIKDLEGNYSWECIGSGSC